MGWLAAASLARWQGLQGSQGPLHGRTEGPPWWWKQAAGPASRGSGREGSLLHGSPTGTPEGLKDTSEGPLLIGLPTSTDLPPPEGRSSTHARAQRRPSNVLPRRYPCARSLCHLKAEIPNNWFHVAARGHMWTGKATSRCHQVTITAPCTRPRTLYNTHTALIELERIETRERPDMKTVNM